MVKTRRSLQGGDGSPVDPKKHKLDRSLRSLHSIAINKIRINAQKNFKVLTGLFKLSKQHLWFRILPVSSFLDARDDIQKATGVDWQYLLPLLCSSGLINVRVTSDVREINVCRVQWDELCGGISKHVRMQLTCCRLKGLGEGQNTRAMQYFFCIGKPLFPSPYKQMEHDKKGQKQTTPTRTNTIHSELVKTIAVRIIYNRIYQRVMGRDVDNSKREKGRRRRTTS